MSEDAVQTLFPLGPDRRDAVEMGRLTVLYSCIIIAQYRHEV